MTRTLITLALSDFPTDYHDLLSGASIYDSSCSRRATVFYIDRDGGCFLKRAPQGTLTHEVEMTRYFHSLGLAASVLDARSEGGYDWMLTTCVPGEDATHANDPTMVCDLTATFLRALHERPTDGCPLPTHTELYLARAYENYRTGNYNKEHFPDNWGYATPEEAWAVIEAEGHRLNADTLLHGDYCLPNIMIQNGQISGLIDLDSAGIGDRHVDLFWGMWSLSFNLKTDAYQDRFLDAYGRDVIDPSMFRLIAACEVFG